MAIESARHQSIKPSKTFVQLLGSTKVTSTCLSSVLSHQSRGGYDVNCGLRSCGGVSGDSSYQMILCRSFSESLLPVLLLGLSDEHLLLQQRCLSLVEGVGTAYSHIQPLAADQVDNSGLTFYLVWLLILNGTWSR